MKKVIFGALLICFTINANAQEYNKWSIDFGLGGHDIINPLSPGYETGILGLGQVNLGVRRMFNEKFGLRVDLGYNEFKEGDNSLPFRSNYYRASLEGVVNAGNLLNFSSWTKRFNLLFHGGAGLSYLRTITPIDNGSAEPILNLIVGFSPQYKISNRISLFLDVSTIFHDYQDFTYDGASNTAAREMTGSIINTSIGINVSIGKQKQNADFIESEETFVTSEIDEIKKRLIVAEGDIAELKIKKTEIDKKQLVTELDNRYLRADSKQDKYSNVVVDSNVDFIRSLLEKGYVNVYFDVNKTKIQDGSLNSVYYLKQFMTDNPHVSAVLTGYADETGKEGQNKVLSENRAKSVFDILVSAGISPTRLSYFGAGEDKSVTEKARQFARKVTFKIN